MRIRMIFRVFIIAGLFLCLCCSAVVAQAEEPAISENQIKAAFAVNITRYVTWPPSDRETVLIGILGKGGMGREWQNVSGKNFGGKKLVVFKSANIDEVLGCHVVFIEETNRKKMTPILQVLRTYPIVTIGDSPAFLTAGGTLSVTLRSDRITFSVNLAQARSVGLEISSNLLKLATEVIK